MGIQSALKSALSNEDLEFQNAPKSPITPGLGNHSIDSAEVLQDKHSLTPTDPGSFKRFHYLPKLDKAIKKGQVVIKPGSLPKLKVLAQAAQDQADSTERGMRHLKRIKQSEKRINVANFDYKKYAANRDFESAEAATGYAKAQHKLRPKYTRLGEGLDQTADAANTEVDLVLKGLVYS